MGEVKVNSLVKLYALMLLGEGQVHGYELMRKIGEKLGRKVSAGQMYPFLKELRAKKYLHVVEKGEREKKEFALTGGGRKFVRGLLEQFGSIVELAVSKKISVCAHCGCKVYEGGFRKGGKAYCCKMCAQ